MSEKILEIRHLSKTFGTNLVLKDIDFTVNSKDVTCIIGASGSGKSTFIRCINHLEEPTSGTISIAGTPVTKKNRLEMAKKYSSMVFQQFNLYPHLTVLENLTLAPVKLQHVPKDKARETALKCLDRVGLKAKAGNYPAQLSGGEQQRVSIARALKKNPKILLCDEPTGALDYNTSKEILKLIEDVNEKYGNTIIMVTHNEAIKNMADHVIKLRDGAVRHNERNEHRISAADLEW